MRTTLSRLAMAGAFVSLVAFTAVEANAQRGRGGGAHGGATSMNRGGGAHASQGTGFSRGGSYSRPSGGASASQRPASGGNRSNINTGNINTGNVHRGNVNTGNINTGNVNIHIDNDHNGWGGWHDYPIAAGVAIGAVAVATRAVVLGSAYYALPPACSPYAWQSYTYYYCGGAYYRPQYEGDTIVYIAVAKPK